MIDAQRAFIEMKITSCKVLINGIVLQCLVKICTIKRKTTYHGVARGDFHSIVRKGILDIITAVAIISKQGMPDTMSRYC